MRAKLVKPCGQCCEAPDCPTGSAGQNGVRQVLRRQLSRLTLANGELPAPGECRFGGGFADHQGERGREGAAARPLARPPGGTGDFKYHPRSGYKT